MDNPNIVYLQDNPVKGSYDYIFYVNYPYRNDTQVTDVLNQCELIAGFMSFDVEVGYIMKC